jgi:hypothetical protein
MGLSVSTEPGCTSLEHRKLFSWKGSLKVALHRGRQGFQEPDSTLASRTSWKVSVRVGDFFRS